MTWTARVDQAHGSKRGSAARAPYGKEEGNWTTAVAIVQAIMVCGWKGAGLVGLSGRCEAPK